MTYVREFFPAVEQMIRDERPTDETLARYYFRLGYMAGIGVEDK